MASRAGEPDRRRAAGQHRPEGGVGTAAVHLTRRRALALAAAGGVGLAACARPLVGGAAASTGSRRLLLLEPPVSGPGRAVASEVRGQLLAVGYAVDRLSWIQAAEPGRLDPLRHLALVLPDARTFPVPAIPNLLRFLRPQGGGPAGSLVALGGPFLSRPMQPSGREWTTVAAAQLQAAAASSPVISAPPTAWASAGATAGDRPRFGGTPRDFTLKIPSLTNWGSGQIPVRRPAFGAAQTITAFAARGLGGTRCFIVEWDEADGSRWIATVRVTADWQGYALGPEAFTYWPDPPVRGRGGAGDRLHPSRAVRLSVGVDTAHCGPVSGPQQVEVRDFGTAAGDAGAAALGAMPRLTGLWPLSSGDADETYVITEPVAVTPTSGAGIALDLPALDGVSGVVSPVGRSRGFGSAGAVVPPYRFVPLLTAADAGGVWRGTPGAAVVHGAGPASGAVWVTLGLPGQALADHAAYVGAFAAKATSAVVGGVRLWHGGAPAAVTAGQTLDLGATPLPGHGQTAASFLLDGRSVGPGPVSAPSPGLHQVTVQAGGDRIAGTIRVCPSPPKRRQGPVTVSGGDLVADGAPWRPVGVNYWPRSTSGLSADLYAAGWLSPLLYDPDVVEADLSALHGLGCNYVSGIQYKSVDQAPALRDFLARCDDHGIRASVYLRGANPLGPDAAQMQGLIAAADLNRDTAVAAYEPAWEPLLGNAAGRRSLAAAWQSWVDDQYGSLARAQAQWGYAGGEGGPSDDQLRQDGPWTTMVAAYRRFADDYITAGYGRTWSAIRGLGDTHLLWARTGYGGTGQMSVVTQMPFDLASGALYLDAVCPEGWGLGAADAASGGLTTAYGRAVGAGKPVLWMEFGTNIWADPQSGRPAQGQAFTAILQMVEASGANGAAGWWFPGGLRVDEGSDYGVFDADGTPRPAALALSTTAKGLAGRSAGTTPVDAWIDVDRDRYVTGYAGVWAAAKAVYLAHVQAGRFPGVRLPGAGTTSADCPLTALGGGAYPGYGPLQALNAAFTRVSIHGRAVSEGERVAGSATVDVVAGNTAPAAWGDDVRLVVDLPDGSSVRSAPGAPVPFLGFGTFAPVHLPAATGEVRLRLEARGGIPFGPIFRFQVG